MNIIFSGINLFQGGGLSVYYDYLDEVCELKLYETNNITAFVHNKELFSKYPSEIKFIELPKSRKSYLNRLYYELIYFYKYSQKNAVDVWISMHDITPRVIAKKQYTYCHTPSPFMKKDLRKIKYSKKLVLFAFFYKYVYRLNIKSATAVIVQQDWMRKEFQKMYPVRKVIVAKPYISQSYDFVDRSIKNKGKIFIYPSFPRYFKNFELICEAVRILHDANVVGYKVQITIDGTENKYASEIREKYGDLSEIEWLGLLKRNELMNKYNEANCLIFPSKMETWGLPISEFKATGKPMLLADLPYAYETVSKYREVAFFDPNDPRELAEMLKNFIEGKMKFVGNEEKKYEPPFAQNWNELLNMLVTNIDS